MLIIRMTIIFNWFVRKPTESNEKKDGSYYFLFPLL